jgi:hypothetical protein
MGQRPDEPIRDGMMLPGENPEEIKKRRKLGDELVGQPVEEAREVTREAPVKIIRHSGGQGAHRWERDETGRSIAMGKIPDKTHGMAPPRRVTDPVTDVENRIIPTPPIRAGPIKYPRDVPPVVMATGPTDREPLGRVERYGPKHGHSQFFKGSVRQEQLLSKQLSQILQSYQTGKITRDHALLEGRKAIDGNQTRVLEIARKKASRVVGKRIIELSPEVSNRLEAIRTQALTDFQRIIDDSEPV